MIAWKEWNAAGHHFVQGLAGDNGLEVAIPMFEYRHNRDESVSKAKKNITGKLAKILTVTTSIKV